MAWDYNILLSNPTTLQLTVSKEAAVQSDHWMAEQWQVIALPQVMTTGMCTSKTCSHYTTEYSKWAHAVAQMTSLVGKVCKGSLYR